MELLQLKESIFQLVFVVESDSVELGPGHTELVQHLCNGCINGTDEVCTYTLFVHNNVRTVVVVARCFYHK